MSQAQFLQDTDATLHAAFLGAAMADSGSYLPPGEDQTAVDVGVYVDDVVLEELGSGATAVARRREITLLRSEVSTPQRGGVVTLADATAWRLEKKLDEDDGISRWVVQSAG